MQWQRHDNALTVNDILQTKISKSWICIWWKLMLQKSLINFDIFSYFQFCLEDFTSSEEIVPFKVFHSFSCVSFLFNVFIRVCPQTTSAIFMTFLLYYSIHILSKFRLVYPFSTKSRCLYSTIFNVNL